MIQAPKPQNPNANPTQPSCVIEVGASVQIFFPTHKHPPIKNAYSPNTQGYYVSGAYDEGWGLL